MTGNSMIPNHMAKYSKDIHYRLLFFFLPLVICFYPFQIGFCQSSALSGKAFSDHFSTYLMDPEWVNKPIQYEPSVKEADLVITLEQNFSQLLIPLIQEYGKQHGLSIFIEEGTCGISAGKIRNKSVDIGSFCCPPGTTDRLPGLRFHTIGIGAVALIVHSDNPTKNISLDQARQIFSGNIRMWNKVNNSNTKKWTAETLIDPVVRLHCKTRLGHWRILLDNEELFGPDVEEVGAIPDMISVVANKRSAIGYEYIWCIYHYKDLGKVNILKIDGIHPSDQETLANNKYPLYLVLNLTTWEQEEQTKPNALKLVRYIREKVDSLDLKYHIVPVSKLKESGWKFRDQELIGEPAK